MSQSITNGAEDGCKGLVQTRNDTYRRATNLAQTLLPIEKRNDIEDIVQDVWVKLLEKGIDIERLEDPKNFVLKCVKHRCIDEWRRCWLTPQNTVFLDDSRNDEEEGMTFELIDPARGPAMDAEINIDNERYRRTLESLCEDLTDREKRLLALRLEGFTNEEIANMWDEDVKAIRADMNAVMSKIRYRAKHLAETGTPPVVP